MEKVLSIKVGSIYKLLDRWEKPVLNSLASLSILVYLC